MIRISCVMKKQASSEDMQAISKLIAESEFGIVPEVIGKQGETIIRGQWIARPFDEKLAEYVRDLKDCVPFILVEYE